MENHQQPVHFAQRLLSYLVCVLLAGQPVFPAFAATTPANGATQMDRAGNGVPVVNIATPNGAGVSHNQFKDYNVGKEGIILNNATGQLNQTQLGGLIQNNPNLQAGKEARGIINEVTGGNRSQLQGYTEVAGKAANVMVANPYGITCSGCGFINTPNATLTTGKPVFDASGNLQAIETTKGSITVEGQGLDASQTDAVSIIARATEVNAAIHAKDLQIIAGANRVSAAGTVTAIKGEGAAPTVAVDTSALGGMYANRIRLVSSEKGVGVNLGNLNARQGDITLDASGRLAVKNSLAGGAISAKGQDIALTGDHKASGNITLDSESNIALSHGSLNSDGDLVLTAGDKLTQVGEKLTAGRDASLSGKNISQDTASQINAARHITAKASDTLSSQGQITAGQNLTVNSSSLAQSGRLLAGGNAQLNSGTFNNSGLVQGNALAVRGTTLNNDGSLLSGTTLNVQTQDFTQTGSAGAKGRTDITASRSLINNGSLVTDEALTLKAGNVTQNGTLSGGKALTLTASTLNTSKSALTHSGDALSVQVSTATLGGELSAGGDMRLSADQLSTVGGAQVQSGNNLSITAREASLAGTQAARNALAVNTSGTLSHSGGSSANDATLTAPVLNNSGTVVASTLRTQSQTLINNGMLQGDNQLSLGTDTLNNLQGGTLYSALALTLDIPNITNHGVIASHDALTVRGHDLSNSGQVLGSVLSFELGSLSNSGALQSDSLLTMNGGTFSNSQSGSLYSSGAVALSGTDISNSGLITSDSGLTLKATTLTNPGKIIASTLSVTAEKLAGEGLLQGENGLTLAGGDLSQGAAGRWLTAGDLSIDGTTLTTAGITQGQRLNIDAEGWNNAGSVLATGGLNSTLSASLLNSGEVMSQGNLAFTAPMLTNHGNLLAAGDLSLSGQQFTSDGTLQGGTLGLTYHDVNNQGTVIGLHGLTLNSHGTLTNSGDLLSQRDLSVKATDVTNSGYLQGGNITLDGSSLTNSGAIQSALDLALTLSGDVIAATGSKITALGDARLSGKALSNQGLIGAKTLEVKGDSLSNGGEISGVNGLNVALNGNLQQQSKMLTGGLLNVKAKEIGNSGQMQGAETQVYADTLTNRGRIQGDSALTLTLLNALTNQAGGALLSQNTLNITAPVLTNDGMLQGNGKTTLSAVTQARNGGKILSGGDLSFTTPDYSGSGWLQATNLVLNVAKLASSGTVMAANQATLTGNSLDNGGTFQAAMLNVNYQAIGNGGTLLGNQGLTLRGNSLNNAGGKVFSGGDMLTEMVSLSGAGQLVALGNLTLKLTNSFTTQGVIAANGQLAISSQGDITNASTLQGNGITLSAAGRLTNNALLTAGDGTTALSGSQIAMNASGSLQAGGDVTLTSRGDITIGGFLGTAGSLTLNATGSLLNSALLYAGNNMYLLANSIKNQRGDMLAGNNLVMQKDASGTANAEVINTSGNIETTNGDITIKTGHLLNEAEGLTISSSEQEYPDAIPAAEEHYFSYDLNGRRSDFVLFLEDWKNNGSNVAYYTYINCISGGANGSGQCSNRVAYRLTGEDIRQFLLSESVVSVSATGSSARIAAGRDINIHAETLDNRASHILAERHAVLTGGTLNNLSAEGGRRITYIQAEYRCEWFYRDCSDDKWKPLTQYADGSWGWFDEDYGWYGWVPYILGERTTEFVAEGGEYRSVISAGGNVSANFTSDISNTNTTANAGKISNIISAPDLNTPSAQSISGGASQQALTDAATQAITGPDWKDISGDASQTIGGGTGLAAGGMDGNYPLPSGNSGYFVPSTNPDSPYLITVNPKLDGLGQLDPSLFGDLYALMGIRPGEAPRETSSTFTYENKFLGSSYFMDRLNLHPEYDYRFLGDAAFDTRYVSNYLLNQTGSRYINGVGSDLAQMQYLMDNAAGAQQALGLQFGIALSADQVAALDHSILWWEAATINGQTVMIPKVYLSPKDVTVNNGSVISGNNVQLVSGNITNGGSTIAAQNGLSLDGQNSVSNLNGGLINAGGSLQIASLGDINNIGSTISGKTVALESLDGSINNLTLTDTWSLNGGGKGGSVSIVDTTTGSLAAITSLDTLSLNAGQDINVTGANVAAGGNLLMNAWGDIAVNANQITNGYSQSGFRGKEAASNATTASQGSSITAGGTLGMQAGNDLTIAASAVNAGGNATLVAGNDLNLSAAQTSESAGRGKGESHSTDVARATVSSGGDLTLAAGRDITGQAAGIAAENNVSVQAGRDVNLQAQETTDGSSYHAKKKVEIDESVRQQGTEIASGGDTKIIAGRDVHAEAAQVTASGDIGVGAGRDISLTTATESDYHFKEETKTKKGFLKKTTTHNVEEDSATREAGTLLSGDNVTLQAGNNLLVKGSAVVGDGDVSLNAGNNVDIVAATNTDSTYRLKEKKKSGLMGTGGIGITVGTSKSRHEMNEDGTTQSQSASTVGSTGGNVSITAGNQLHVGGSDLIAGKDLAITGDSVIIDPGHDKRTRDETFEQKSSGLTVALSGTVGSAINNAVSAAQDTKQESDGRLKALQATKTALSGVQAGQAAAMASTTGDPNAMGVSLSLTTQKSKSQQHAESDTVAGSTLNAGNNLSITANGKNKGPNGGDIVIAGSQLKAGGDTVLDAQHDILLAGAANTQKTSGKNSSSGGGVGVSIGAGGSGAGISVFANVNAAKGKEKGNGTGWTETTLDSGRTVTLKSGQDTVLDGAQVSGNKIVADVGHDLLMRSQQDNNDYDSKQASVAAGGSFTFGTMTGSGYINASQDRMKSRFDSVAEQTGIYAGDGGFDITVGKHTQLDGAVIASTATADKNSLDTGTLGFSDIHNEADFKTQHSGVSLSGGGSFGGGEFKGNMPGGTLAAAGNSGHAEGTSQAAVADGSITVRDGENQRQDVASLSRDTAHANGSISPIFDKEKEQRRLQEIGLISDIGGQAADIARTQGELNALNEAKKTYGDLPANATEEQRQAYLSKLRNSPEYKGEMAKYGTGSDVQRGIQAATAALQGLAGGNIGGALAGASAPELAHLLKSTESEPAVNAIAHAILGGAVAAMQGNSAAAGAVGAGTGELAAQAIVQMLYPDVKVLSEEQKQTVSTLASISAGMAGGLAGGDVSGAAAGASAGKNAVENNYLSSKQIDNWSAEMKSCQASGGDCGGIIKKYEELSTAQQQQLISDCAASPSTCQQKYGDVLADSINVKQALDRALGEDIPIKMVYDLTATWAHQMDADGIVASNKVSEQIMAKYGLDQAQADIIAGVALSALGGVSKAGKPKYQPNQDAVGNMKEFLTQPGFGTQIKSGTQKTSQIYQGQSVYKASNNIGTTIKKGDQFYLDGQHKNHLEVFDSKGNFKAVLNLDGSINRVKTEAAKGRKL